MPGEDGKLDFAEMEALFNGDLNTVVPPAPSAPVVPETPAVPPVVETPAAPAAETPAEPPAPVVPPVPAAPVVPPAAPPENKAFAEMRIENARLKAALEKILPASGLGPDLDAAVLAADQKAQEAEAAKLKASPELMARITQQDAEIKQVLLEMNKNNLANAFTNVMQECGITSQQAYDFALELKEANIDVPASLPHLVTLYRGMHHTELVNAAAEKAAQEAALRVAKAEAQSTQPLDVQGSATPPKDGKFTTMEEFEDFLNGVPAP